MGAGHGANGGVLSDESWFVRRLVLRYTVAMTIEEFRRRKDAWFREPDSPLTDGQRKGFSGLRYFSKNPALRFALPLNTDTPHEPVTMQTSTGALREYTRAGTMTAAIGSEPVTFAVYRDVNGFFLPFRDGTCGAESYGAGRYLEPEEHEGKLMIDFNMAYNPYCAYNERYSCPIPPKENWTSVRIEAGEKRFHE